MISATGLTRRFGIVFQDSSLDFELTARENMVIHAVLYHVPAPERAPRIERLLRLFDLWERRDDIVKRFSGGMRRRLEFARCLLHTPAVIFVRSRGREFVSLGQPLLCLLAFGFGGAPRCRDGSSCSDARPAGRPWR